ncbi:hypothetical protein [Desnuesiella massiliensis]|uniref:hypothetical protein n=1 Tax=Desnuesiella massiliensis TaxID=1650662 RepID=UPI0006E2B66E|nr:hypothetical protein [Desnuesiella massiliensis]
MKRAIFITIIVLITIAIFSFLGYKLQKNLVKNVPKNILIPNLRKSKSEVFKSLKLEEGRNIEQNKQSPAMYDYKKKQKFGSEYFTQSLLFDINNNTLYGLLYLNRYSQNSEEGYKEVMRLNKELNKQFGEPTTYSSAGNRIEKMPNYNDLVKSKNALHYLETWKVNDEVMVQLDMNYDTNNGIVVDVVYKLIPPILKNN